MLHNLHLKFQIGEVVRLISGGPTMTVKIQPEPTDEYIDTVWFDDAKNLHRDSFSPKTLEKVGV
jgi:uncharacterized protein YodC (DUF2158 family)